MYKELFMQPGLDVVKQAIRDKGVDAVRRIVYGYDLEHEYIGMRYYIKSRTAATQRAIHTALTNI